MATSRTNVGQRQGARSIGFYLLLALVMGLVAALPLLIGPGIINTRAGGDSPFLVQRTHQMARALRDGAFPVRWMPDANYGLGYPAFNYYAALPYYLAALLHLGGVGILWAIKLTQALGFLLASFFAYRLVRQMGGEPPAALLAAALYTFAPFHLVNVYVRGDALSEFYAMALYPAILWALSSLAERPSLARGALLGLAYGLLILTHNISALLFSPLLLAWLVWERWQSERADAGKILAWGLLAMVLGLGLSAWFWVPALGETSLVQLGEQTTGYFHYSGHFRGWDLVQWRPLHDYAIGDGRDPFAMGALQAVLGIEALLGLAVKRLGSGRIDHRTVIVAGALLIYTWLITPLSRFVWDWLPLLPYAQFPWRLLGIQALLIALLAREMLWQRPRPLPRWRSQVAIVLCALLAVAALGRLPVSHLPISEADVTPQRLMLYESYSSNVGGSVRYEYLPTQMVPRLYTSAVQLQAPAVPKPLVLQGEMTEAERVSAHATEQTWEIATSEPSRLAFHLTYFPGWRAEVDGSQQDVLAPDGLGLVTLDLPAGDHQVRLWFGSTPIRRRAEVLSLLSLALLVAVGLGWGWRQGRGWRQSWPWIASIVAVVLAVILGLVIRPGERAAQSEPEGPLVMDARWMPYLHHATSGVYCGDAELVSYGLSSSELAGGDLLRVMTIWRDVWPEARLRVELYGMSAHFFDDSPQWAEAWTLVEGGKAEAQLAIPDEIPPGLYVLRVRLYHGEKDQPLRSADGRKLAKLVLAPIQVTKARPATGDEELLGAYGPPRERPEIALIDLSCCEPEHRVLQIVPTWRSERQASQNYSLSIRVKDAMGEEVVSRDLEPMLGGYPTSLWQPGTLLSDRINLLLPEDVELTEEHTVEVILYSRATMESVGRVTVPISQCACND